MEDRRAQGNKFIVGVAADKRDGWQPQAQGVSAEDFWGVPQVSPERQAQLERTMGIPMPGPGMVLGESDSAAPRCVATTKKGLPCKAYATKDAAFCAGHLKQGE